MSYTKTVWVDRAVTNAKRYLLTLISGSTYDIEAAPTAVTEEGTAVTAARMNKIEQGIYDAYNGVYKINDITLESDATALNITIPSGYTELDITMFLQSSSSNPETLQIQFNAITTSSYTNASYVIKNNVGSDQNINSYNTTTAIVLNGDGTYGKPIIYGGKGLLKANISNISGINKIFSCRYAGSDSGQRMTLADGIAAITDEISQINLSGYMKAGSRIIVRGIK